jgi:TolB protein
MLVALRVLITTFVVTGFLSVAHAELRIEISQGVEKAVPVAVVPFGWEGRGGTAPFVVGPPLGPAACRSANAATTPAFRLTAD